MGKNSNIDYFHVIVLLKECIYDRVNRCVEGFPFLLLSSSLHRINIILTRWGVGIYRHRLAAIFPTD